MKSIHSDIQKAIDWSSFSRSDLLFLIKLILEKLGEGFEKQVEEQKVKMGEEGKVNRLMESYKTGKLPRGALQLETMPSIKKEIQSMISKGREESINLPNSSMIFRQPVKLDNGEIYEGQWTKDGKRHGVGTWIYPDGSVYQGFWANDLKDGIGRFVNEKEHFEGLFNK